MFEESNIARTWWRLFQKRVVCIKFDIYGFIALPPRERQPAASLRHSSAKSDFVSSAARQKWTKGTSWSWSYCRLIYNYICNHCLSPLKLWVRIAIMGMLTRYNTMWQICQWLTTDCGFLRLFRLMPDKTVRQNIAEILLKVALNAITQHQPKYVNLIYHISW